MLNWPLKLPGIGTGGYLPPSTSLKPAHSTYWIKTFVQFCNKYILLVLLLWNWGKRKKWCQTSWFCLCSSWPSCSSWYRWTLRTSVSSISCCLRVNSCTASLCCNLDSSLRDLISTSRLAAGISAGRFCTHQHPHIIVVTAASLQKSMSQLMVLSATSKHNKQQDNRDTTHTTCALLTWRLTGHLYHLSVLTLLLGL